MRIIALYVDGQPLRPGGLGRDPVPRQPGAGHAGALQAAPRRGRGHAVRAGDRGPGHRPRRRSRWRSGWRWSAASPTRSTGYVVELGTDGRLLALQLDELMAGVDADRELVVRDYLPEPAAERRAPSTRRWPSWTRCRPPSCSTSARWPRRWASRRRPRRSTPRSRPRGFRLLAKVPRLPGAIIERLVEHFGGLQKLLAASVDDLQAVDGVGEARARASARDCPAWPSPRSWSATSERSSARRSRRRGSRRSARARLTRIRTRALSLVERARRLVGRASAGADTTVPAPPRLRRPTRSA